MLGVGRIWTTLTTGSRFTRTVFWIACTIREWRTSAPLEPCLMPQGERYKFNLFLLCCSVLRFISLPASLSKPQTSSPRTPSASHPSLHSCRPSLHCIPRSCIPCPPSLPSSRFRLSLLASCLPCLFPSIVLSILQPTLVWKRHYRVISVRKTVFLSLRLCLHFCHYVVNLINGASVCVCTCVCVCVCVCVCAYVDWTRGLLLTARQPTLTISLHVQITHTWAHTQQLSHH